MLVCPHCQFENPNNNKFCQKCGTSLTHKTCQDCGSQVSLSEANCQNCGALVGTLWWAVISKEPGWQISPASVLKASQQKTSEADLTQDFVEITAAQPLSALPLEPASQGSQSLADPTLEEAIEKVNLGGVDDDPLVTEVARDAAENLPVPLDPSSVSADAEASSPAISKEQLPNELQTRNTEISIQSPISQSPVYLDPAERYRLLESMPSLEDAAGGEIHVRVLDTQPFQKSPLETLTIWSGEWGMQNPQENQQPETAMGVPAIAQPYLALKDQFYPTLPQIHDAWYQDGMSAILLEDRSQWQLLQDLWGSEDLPMLQILEWLDEMVKLWSALELWNCRQSLLEETNLRVDEDHKMSLQKLYREPKDAMTLQDLGQMWQKLFFQSQKTQFGSLGQLIRDLQLGDIVTVEQLRSHLEAIACQLQEERETTTAGENAILSSKDPNPPTSMNDTTIPPEDPIVDSNDGDDMPTVILPMQLLSLEDAGSTDIGLQRDHNEDFFGIHTQSTKDENPTDRTLQARGLYILCDGMGGHAGGEVASAMAVDTIKRYFQANWHDQLPDEDSIREAVRLANKAIYDVNQENARSGSGRMGTTLVLLLIQETKVAIAHVGDSRLYRLSRKRGLEQVTVDHEVGQREIERGVEPALAYSRPDAYQLTQALGPRDENYVHPDVQFLELNEDTLLLLCSDGLSDYKLLEIHWQTHLLPLISSRANLEQGVLQLIDLANQHNKGHDNITGVLVRAKVRPNLDR